MSGLRRQAAVMLVLALLLAACAGGSKEVTEPAGNPLPDGVYAEILKYFQQQKYDLVKNYINEAHKSGFRDKRLYFLSGIIALQAQNTEQAKAAFQEAIKMDPQYSDAHNNLGTIYLNEGQLDQAEYEFHHALQNPLYLTPELAMNNLGKLMEIKGDKVEAARYYQRAIKAKPNFAPAYYNLGVLYFNDGKLSQAEQELGKAVTINPRYLNAWWLYGLTLEKEGKLEDARRAYQQVVKLNPSHPLAVKAGARLLALSDGGQPQQ
ncbi:MAG: tetratricopeptide repeat protein [Deltaproteobacteria bacterium]|nr:tetratricopeptide repeat protein [Deltaproteobacteria bacterium]